MSDKNADRNYEPDVRTDNAECADCGTVRQFGEFFKWHERFGILIGATWVLLCGGCYRARCGNLERN